MFNPVAYDTRVAVRRLLRTPYLTLTVILTITLAVGATTTVFSVVNALALRQLSVSQPERLALVTLTDERDRRDNIPLPTRDALAHNVQAFEAVAAYSTGGVFISDVDGVLHQTPLELVDARYFDTLGITPVLGRRLSELDESESAPAHVAMLGFGFWQRAFGGDRRVIGRTLKVEGVALEIIGVLPNAYIGLSIDVAPDVAVPISLLPELLGSPRDPKRPLRSNYILARLRRETTIAQAEKELESRWPVIRQATVPGGYSPAEQTAYLRLNARIVPLATGMSNLRVKYIQPLVFLLSLAVMLVLAACANVIGLMFIRALDRHQEFAVARALGASRGRMLQQAAIDGVLFSVIGTSGALALASSASRLLGAMIWTGSVPLTVSLTPDWRVLIVTALLASVVGLLSACLPVWLVCRRARFGLTSARSVTRTSGWIGKGLIATQVALALALVFGASLFSRTVLHLHSVTLGFSPRDVVTGRLQTQPGGDRGLDRATYSRDLLTQLRSVPAVESAALCHLFPASIVNTQEVAAADLPTTGIATAFEQVSPGFFGTVRISLLAGRDFTWTDDATGKAVAVISADLASRLFPRGDALSREIRIGASPSEQAVQVVGIVNAVHFGNVRNDAPPVVFRPLLQEPRYQIIPVLVVRSAAGRPLPADDIRRIVAAAGHEFAPDLTTLDKQISQFILQERMLAVLAIAFAGLAALLGFLGLFASLAHGVVNRTREIGVRVALGADTLTIIRMIVSQGLRVSVIGVVAGLPLALAAGQLARTFLFGLSPFDPTALISSAVAFLIIGCLAGVLPARRAARINPVDSLGSE